MESIISKEEYRKPPETSWRDGLSTIEAARQLKKVGYNDPVETHRTSAVIQFLRLFAEPLVMILLGAALISFIVGEVVNATIIVVMILLSVTLNFVQTARSERAARRLRSEVSLTATVLRDGTWQEIPRREVVPNDVIRIIAGNLVPADAELIFARDLHIQEAALTGESLPVEKDISDPEKRIVLLGTSVVSGAGEAIVKATGRETAFGKIATQLTERAPETSFEQGTRAFGYLIMRIVFILVIFVFLINTILHRDPLESLFFSIALAIGLTPEFLPMITAVTLGQGAVKMAKQKVIVKHLSAIQNFGSMDILCSDKTGTLTSGELSLTGHLDPLGNAAERTFLLAFLSSYFETGVGNPLDRAIKSTANPLDEAILRHDRPDVHLYKKIDEAPFDFERRRMSVVVEKEGEKLLICKGAPESVLEVCRKYEVRSKSLDLNKDARAKCIAIFNDLSAKGLRVLAVAYKKVSGNNAFRAADESDLIFAGFLNFSDEPLESAAGTLRKMGEDGVQVKILTGDNELVARHVCEKVGLNGNRIVLGSEIERMSDPALAHFVEQTTIFARVSPMQKHRILLALKRRGHVVGFLGDGINDAPSLRAADVGISVASATDVAKDAAEIVLLERSLGVLHSGIIEGRKSFGNVMKYLMMGTSSNFGNMLSMAGASAFLPFLPMLPTQILLNNFLYDLAQITIPTDNVDRTFIRKPHRWDIKTIRDFMLYIGPVSSLYDFLTFYILFHVFAAGEQLFHTGWFVESLATQTLVVFIIRTAGNPLRSRPSIALTLTVLGVVLFAIILPFTSLGGTLGFVPLPFTFFVFLTLATITYLIFVEIVKRYLMRRLIA